MTPNGAYIQPLVYFYYYSTTFINILQGLSDEEFKSLYKWWLYTVLKCNQNTLKVFNSMDYNIICIWYNLSGLLSYTRNYIIIVCLGFDLVRLTHPADDGSYTVEINYNQRWRVMTGTRWSSANARVVCRQTGQPW